MPPPVNTNFTCRDRKMGFYADIETNCRVYHTCDDHGNKFTYYCPAETAFRQEALVCDHAHLVDCANARRISKVEDIDVKNFEKNEKDKIFLLPVAEETFLNNDSLLKEVRKLGKQSSASFQSGNYNSAYTRSFTITPEPSSQFLMPKPPKRQEPTFTLSSSVFPRDRTNFEKILPESQLNRKEVDVFNNLNNSKHLSNHDSGRRAEHGNGFSTTGSATVPTSIPAFGAGFEMRGNFRNPTDFRSWNIHKDETSTERFFRKLTFSTSPRSIISFNENREVNGAPDNPQALGKFKLNDANDKKISGNSASQIQHDIEKDSSGEFPIEVLFDDKKRNDKKIISADDFQIHPANTEKNSRPEFANRGKTNEEFFQFFENFRKEPSTLKNLERFDNNSNDSQFQEPSWRPFFFHSGNFPYSETLRSMQTVAERSLQPSLSNGRFNYSNMALTTISSPIETAGTEFPVHSFTSSVSRAGPNELDDDPYYPKRSTTTESYFKLSDLDKNGKNSFRFSTKMPWPGSRNFEIPEVLPDLNTLDDLVDRRKLFYIAKVKTF